MYMYGSAYSNLAGVAGGGAAHSGAERQRAGGARDVQERHVRHQHEGGGRR